MTDWPIIFSAPMVRALLEGRKTMTRRMAWRECAGSKAIPFKHPCATLWQRVKPGDRLWVREACGTGGYFQYPWAYRADGKEHPTEKWTPSIYMPRRASRLTLTVTATRIERLQEIKKLSLSQVQAEGIDVGPLSTEGAWHQFMFLWESLHGPGSWDENPEVVVLTFAVHKVNIDDSTPPPREQPAHGDGGPPDQSPGDYGDINS